MVKMSLHLESAVNKIKDMQSSNGGFVWFKGGPDDRYMTQYIVSGIGHLKKLNGIPASQQNVLKSILDKAIPYLDARLKDDYDNLIKYKAVFRNIKLLRLQKLHISITVSSHKNTG